MPRSHGRGALATAGAFLAILLLVMSAFEATARARIAQARGQNLIGAEIYDARAWARQASPDVQRIILGDSVARQLFPIGTEPNGRVRFLTTNATITVAGNFYLAQEAFQMCPNARDIYLIVRPETLAMNLDPQFSDNYFSEYFHRPDQVLELWRVKHDGRFTVQQALRWALEGTFGVNAAWRQEPRSLERPGRVYPRASGDGPAPVEVSMVASHFLSRLKELAGSRGGSLHVLPVPIPTNEPWFDPPGVFEGPFLYGPADAFGDLVHLGPVAHGVRMCAGTQVAAQFGEAHSMSRDLPLAGALQGELPCEDAEHPVRLSPVRATSAR